jgi:hypothetical protein
MGERAGRPRAASGLRRPVSLETYLADHPGSLALLESLRSRLEAIGPTQERMSPSQVAFRRERPVAWAWAPGQYLGGRVAPLVLSLELPRRDPSPRWKEVVEVRPGRFMHHLELSAAEDLDDEVDGWLQRAWEAAGWTSSGSATPPG